MARSIAALALSLSLAALGCATSGGGARDAHDVSGGRAEVGKPAPDLAIQSLDGKRHLSLEEMQGKVVIVDFWATWCKPCRKSFPALEELARTGGDNVAVIGISVDEDGAGIPEFVKETGVTFPVAWDKDHAIASRWKMGTMPTTFIVDRTGKVRHIHDGYHDNEATEIAKELSALAGEGGGETKVAVPTSPPPPPSAEEKKPIVEETKPEPVAEPEPEKAVAKKAGGKKKGSGGAKKAGGGKKAPGKTGKKAPKKKPV